MIQNIYYLKRNQGFSKTLTRIQAKTRKVNLENNHGELWAWFLSVIMCPLQGRILENSERGGWVSHPPPPATLNDNPELSND